MQIYKSNRQATINQQNKRETQQPKKPSNTLNRYANCLNKTIKTANTPKQLKSNQIPKFQNKKLTTNKIKT